MILDATAGNRAIWEYKYSANIIYIDIERKLERKPTIFADNTKMPFRDETFDTIFFDPPYAWGSDNLWYTFPDSESYFKTFNEKREAPRYYGVDKFKSRSSLVAGIFLALKEFYRVLKEDGLLWLKWCEVRISLKRVLTIFANWQELLLLHTNDPLQTHSDCQTYWIAFQKKGYCYQTSLVNIA